MQRLVVLLICLPLFPAPLARADIFDFTEWTEVQDPADPNFSSAATPLTASLIAGNGAVSTGTDVGFQSINGLTASTSTQGYAFEATSDFAIAIDYQWTFTGTPTGFLALGFGVGEDGDGANSVGVVASTLNGAPFSTFAGAARINNVNEDVLFLGLNATSTGSLFISHEASTGDVTVGAAATPGAAVATHSSTYADLQNQWTNKDLLASFFIRSDVLGWQGGGTGTATFSNFRLLAGSATAVPEPQAVHAILILSAYVVGRRGRHR